MAFGPPRNEAATAGHDDPATTAGGSLVRRAAVAVGIGALVLIGWSSTAAADGGTGHPTPSLDAAPAVTVVDSAPKAAPTKASDLAPVTTLLAPVTHAVGDTLGQVTAPVTTGLAPTVEATTTALRPVTDSVQGAVLDPLAPVVEPVLAAVQPAVDQVLAPIARPVVDDVVAPLATPTLAPIAEAAAKGLDLPADGILGEVLGTVVEPVTGDLLAPLASDADDVEIIDAIDLDQPAGLTATPAQGAPVVTVAPGTEDDVEIIDAIDLDRDPTEAPTAEPSTGSTSDETGVPASSRPNNSPCTGRTCAAAGFAVLFTVAAISGLTATSRRISARTTGDDRPTGRPLAQPGFAPD